jgi:hypothetical protein
VGTSSSPPSARSAHRSKQLAGVAVASALLLGTSVQWGPGAAEAATPAPSPTPTASTSPAAAPSPTTSSAPGSITVQVYAFPAPDTYAHVSGTVVPMALVGTTTLPDITDRTFSVLLNVPAGTVNLDAIGLSGGSIVEEDSFPAASTGNASAETASTQTYTLTFPANQDVSTTGVKAADAQAVASPQECTTYFVRSLGTPWVTVGGEFATTNGGTATFNYGDGASTTLGVGYSPTGAVGTFSLGGTETWSSSASQGFPVEWYSYGSHHFETEFSEEEDETYCYQARTGQYSYNYFNHVDGWDGGDEAVAVNSISAPYCVPEEPGSSGVTFELNSSSAWTFTAGLSLPILDLNATAQTGYNSSASWAFEFNPNDNRHLCGALGYPATGTPGLVQVEPW